MSTFHLTKEQLKTWEMGWSNPNGAALVDRKRREKMSDENNTPVVTTRFLDGNKFRPFEVTFKVETEADLHELWHRFNISSAKLAYPNGGSVKAINTDGERPSYPGIETPDLVVQLWAVMQRRWDELK